MLRPDPSYFLFPCVRFFDATLGMGGWLDLAQQGLSPCKKYRASWRSFAKSYRIIELVQPRLVLQASRGFLIVTLLRV